MTTKEKIEVERLRLRKMNPAVQVMGHGWLKLSAVARVNVFRRATIYNQVAEEVLQSHCIGMDAAIVIEGMVPNIPIDADQRQLTIF